MRSLAAIGIACVVCLASHLDARQNDPLPSEPGANTESKVARYERELASRLVDVTKAEQLEVTQRQSVEQLQARVEQARQSGNEAEIQSAEWEYHSAEESLTRLAANTRAAKELYDQAKIELDIGRKNAELESKKSESPTNGQTEKTPLDDVLNKRNRVVQATEEAELAQKKTLTLRQQLETLLNCEREIRRTSDRLSQRLVSVTSADVLRASSVWRAFGTQIG